MLLLALSREVDVNIAHHVDFGTIVRERLRKHGSVCCFESVLIEVLLDVFEFVGARGGGARSVSKSVVEVLLSRALLDLQQING